MNDTKTVRTPTLKEFKAAGYSIIVEHLRRYKIVGKDPRTGKIYVSIVSGASRSTNKNSRNVELLARGGSTTVTIIDPDTGTEFFSAARCRDNENFSKKIGIKYCLNRITSLMLVCSGKDGFTFKIEV